jgi:hypothetical protein
MSLRGSPQTASNPSSGPSGHVFFTLNGIRLPNTIEQSNCGLYPILHIQKRGIVVSANFGSKPFVYLEAKRAHAGEMSNQNRLVRSASAGTGESDGLLRRVSDSLQDLSLGLSFGAFPPDSIDSDSELNILNDGTDESDGTLSASSENSDQFLEAIDSDDEDEDLEALLRETESDNRSIADDNPTNDFDPIELITPAIRVTPPPPSLPATSNGTRHISHTNLPKSDSQSETAQKKPHPFSIAVAKTSLAEYNPVSSLDYFLEASPANSIKMYSGPCRRNCSCASHIPAPLDVLMIPKGNASKDDNNSSSAAERNQSGSPNGPDDENSSEDEEDIHTQLVRAWELRVFPIIRRRFRNESERRDGLEQIRGALQLGMIEIARQTVEFLYEEGGVIPRELHLPTIEEIREEAARCSVEKVKPGMNVLIRPLSSLKDYNSVLPEFAVPAMLRTFGLVGEVLDVDSVRTLLQIKIFYRLKSKNKRVNNPSKTTGPRVSPRGDLCGI